MSLRRFTLATSFVVVGPALFAACQADTVSPPAVSATVPASLSLEWQEKTGSLIAAGRMSPLAAGRVYAAVSVAQDHAITAVDDVGGRGDGGLRQARLGAIAAASAQVLGFLFPSAVGSLEDELTTALEGRRGNVREEFARGMELGRVVGNDMIQRLKNDGFTRAWSGTAPTGAGIWTPVSLPPSGVMLGSATPYFLKSGDQFRPAPPPAFGSAGFTADLNEVLQFAQHRTPEQLALAKSWDYAAGTTTPVGYWNNVAISYITERGLDEVAAIRVLSLMHAAVFDAQIACWDAKYTYWFIRPYQANTAIATVLSAPNHPSYPSGHSCVSASAARVLAHFFPTHTTELDNLVTDAGMSRVYAGIHYRFDITAGQQLGRAVADWAIAQAH